MPIIQDGDEMLARCSRLAVLSFAFEERMESSRDFDRVSNAIDQTDKQTGKQTGKQVTNKVHPAAYLPPYIPMSPGTVGSKKGRIRVPFSQ